MPSSLGKPRSGNGAARHSLPSELLTRWYQLLTEFSSSHYTLAIALIVVLTVLVNGVGTIPREPYRLTAIDPFREVQAHPENYFQRSPLLPLIAHFLRLTSRFEFAGLSLTIVLVGWALLGSLSRQRDGETLGFLSTALIVLHPVSLVLISWLGTPDALTFLLTCIFLYSRSPFVLGVAAALGGFNHPISVLVAPALLGLRQAADEQIGSRNWLAVSVGLVIGSLGVLVFLKAFDIQAYTRLDFLLSRNLSTWIRQNLSLLPHSLYSLHQIVWLPIGMSLLVMPRRTRRYVGTFALIQVIFYLVAFFSADTTRVFSLLGWAPALHFIRKAVTTAREDHDPAREGQLLKSLALVVLIGQLIPRYYVWTGELHPPNFNGTYFPVLSWLRGLF